jgi:hypothetical protein
MIKRAPSSVRRTPTRAERGQQRGAEVQPQCTRFPQEKQGASRGGGLLHIGIPASRLLTSLASEAAARGQFRTASGLLSCAMAARPGGAR